MKHIKPFDDFLNEGFAQNSRLAYAITGVRKEKENFYDTPKATIDLILAADLRDSDIFTFASLFPRDSFRADYITNGKLESEIKRLYMSGDTQDKYLKKAKALKALFADLDKYFGSHEWVNTKLY